MSGKAIYAGTFDPMTYGHLDVIQRAARIFDHLTVAVADRPSKNLMFSTAERIDLIEQSVSSLENVAVEAFSGLLVNYVRDKGVRVIVRGLRAVSDFEFEFQMALSNRKMEPDIETMFLMPKEEYSYVSSGTVKEIAQLNGNIEPFVPPATLKAFKKKLETA